MHKIVQFKSNYHIIKNEYIYYIDSTFSLDRTIFLKGLVNRFNLNFNIMLYILLYNNIYNITLKSPNLCKKANLFCPLTCMI